ncbi:MAG: glycosyltransferase family 39 protein [Candidatus Omnitrophica bacterium]|nr:glycosyltransferase family 39 protein [Candidatus Omnitrophota bacterium]
MEIRLKNVDEEKTYTFFPGLYGWIFILNVVIACVIRLPYLFTEMMGSDEALYAWCAQRIFYQPSIILSREIIEYHPPFFPLILSIGNAFSDPVVVYRMIALLISLLGILTIYILGSLISSRFVGLVAAILLNFNYVYLLQADQLYIDVSQLVVFNLFLIALIKAGESDDFRHHFYVGAVASLAVLLKWSGVIVIPFLVIYYLSLPGPYFLAQKIRRLRISLVVVSGVILLLLINNRIQLGSFLPNVETLTGEGHEIQPVWYYIGQIFNILMFPYLLPLFLYGLYIIIKMGHRYKILLLVSLFVFWSAISLPPVKVLRYGLMVLPIMLIVCGLGLEELLKRLSRNHWRRGVLEIIGIFILCGVCWSTFPRTEVLLKMSFTTSTGLGEAGQWIRQKVRPQTTVISRNLRPTRYYCGLNFRQYGGQLVLLPQYKIDFEKLIAQISGPIILQVDLWSESNPSDFYPFSKAEREDRYFAEHGFRLTKIISRDVYSKVGWKKQRVPVIKLYERP